VLNRKGGPIYCLRLLGDLLFTPRCNSAGMQASLVSTGRKLFMLVAGMRGVRNDPSLLALGSRYDYNDSAGATVTLMVRSWDTSSPFQIKPNRNKMTVELLRKGETLQIYSNWYED